MKRLVILSICLSVAGCARNVEEAKQCAPAAAKAAGFELAGYQGYNLDLVYGGMVWYFMKRVPDNGILYEASFSPWGGECHIYNEKALDAIAPGQRR